MPMSFDSYLGVHAPALQLQSRRAQLLASNLANLDTPGYKARDIDFRQVLSGQVDDQSATKLMVTRSRHIQMDDEFSPDNALYRQPHQPAVDGNTVEHQVELAAYTDNAMRYMASLRFLSGKLNTLRTAIKGQ